MSQPNNRRRDPGGFSAETLLLAIGIGLVLVTLVVVNVAQHLGHAIDGDGVSVPGDPFKVIFQTFGGDLAWPAAGTRILIGCGVGVFVLVVLGFVAYARYRKRRTRVDRAA